MGRLTLRPSMTSGDGPSLAAPGRVVVQYEVFGLMPGQGKAFVSRTKDYQWTLYRVGDDNKPIPMSPARYTDAETALAALERMLE